MVKVEDFSKVFSEFRIKLPSKVERMMKDYSLVGSTKHNGEGRDFDVVVLVKSIQTFAEELELLGWENESSGVDNIYPDTFYSLRKEDFNLLITQEKEFFQRMQNSARVIRRVQSIFGRLYRADVCDIYSIILYGHIVNE